MVQGRLYLIKVPRDTNKDGKGMSDDLEGWYKVGDCGVPSPEFAGISSPLGLSTSVVSWVADGAGADG
ncbi:hypothetical protein Tco_1242026 [Tanacetum coccineum]